MFTTPRTVRTSLLSPVSGMNWALRVALEHTPPTQVFPPVHVTPQLPQLLLSELVLMQVLPHTLVPLGQAHVPLWQVVPLVHVTPHAPQLLELPDTSMHTPLQRSWPAIGQSVHTPAVHCWPELHTLPQVPQSLPSFWRSKQPPVHCVNPCRHVHLPVEHVEFGPHAFPHAPQLLPFVCRSTHRPEQALKPPPHTHLPAVHCCTVPQLVAQVPQLL